MRIYPKTTFSQITVILISLLLINLFISFVALRWLVITPSSVHFAELIANQLWLLEYNLAKMTLQQADHFLQTTFPHTDFQVKSSTSHLSTLPRILFYQLFADHLQQQIGIKPLSIRLGDQNNQAMLWFHLDWMQGYWLGIPFQMYLQNVYRLVGIIFIATSVLSIVTGFIITRYILKPLKQLAEWAQSMGQMESQLPLLKQKGSLEVQQVMRRLEKTAYQVRQLIHDRELMMAGVSHDLRTPLARLRIATEWMPEPELQSDMISDIEEMDDIISGFIDYIQAGQGEEEQPLNINRLLEKLRHDFERRNQIINLMVNNYCPKLMLRPVAMTRLLTNLLDNAFKYGKLPIELTAFKRQNQFQIWVKDRGKGIDQEQIATLLEPFHQGNHARSQKGAGLGLAIALRIAQSHQAELIVKNRQHGGLKVGIVFPHLEQWA